MLLAMHHERLRFDEKGIKDPFNYVHSLEDRHQSDTALAKCGSVKEYVRSHLP
jgi:hypothetical protein